MTHTKPSTERLGHTHQQSGCDTNTSTEQIGQTHTWIDQDISSPIERL